MRPLRIRWTTSVQVAATAGLLLALGNGAAHAQDTTPIERSPEFKQRVKASIEKGVAWLRSIVREDGSCTDWTSDLELAAATYHTMRLCGTPREDPVAAKIFEYVQRECAEIIADKDLEFFGTGEFHFVAAAIADHGERAASADVAGEPSYVLSKQDKTLLTTLASYVERFQGADGTWSLSRILAQDRDCRGDVAGLYTYAALMGLEISSRCGIKVQRATWDKSLRYFVRTQDPRGETIKVADAAPGSRGKQKARGWDFDAPASSPDFFPFELDTSNALAALVICRSEILNGQKGKPSPDLKTDLAIGDGMRFLGRNTFVLDEIKEGGDDFDMKFMSAIERACGLAGVERLGSIDWYGEAAEALMRHQERSGAWFDATAKNDLGPESRRSDAVDATCHALLVLARGTPRVRWASTAAPDDTDINFGVAAALSDRDFEDFLDLVLSRWRRATDAAVKDRFLTKATAVGPRIVAPLVQRLASLEPEERTAAFALLRHATGLAHDYDPAGPDEARAKAVAVWRGWLLANEKSLVFDAATGRIVAK